MGILLATRNVGPDRSGAVEFWPCRVNGALSDLIESFDSTLPLVDFGCGDGVLTEHLVEHFDVVIGTDISEAAVAKARRDNKGSKVSYEQLDGTDTVGAGRLHVRLGQRGHVFDIEITPEFRQILQDTVERFGEWAARMRREQSNGLALNELSASDLADLYHSKGWTLQSVGELSGRSQLRLPDGSFFTYPFSYVIATRESSIP